ncbi:MAG: Alternative cytochrome c oxidase polypeptide CoxO [Cytophagales bacterium]|jgi:cytochrome c oxidase subunit 3|nr:cytochrome c oxidase subunit 3 [Bacteroidota bacterium]MBS1981955.1 cytochrome c oxidase subunit 3 [Bacteroidota bacterium]WHZ09405.1 MAG: Alternative cytochrome c oxidase polypeptide CoxO [Cytophagales bacterium]
MENTADLRIVEEPKRPLAMNPKKFGMWLLLVTVMMMFMSVTSAYIVRQAEGNWLYFELPVSFYISSVIIVVSSIFMQMAYGSAKQNELGKVKKLISFTAILGLAFLVVQFIGWRQLVQANVYLVGNPSGSFLYIITGLHALHLLSAIIFLLIMLAAAFKDKISSGNMTKMEMCTTYWHFLGGLWLYLFVFLLLYR